MMQNSVSGNIITKEIGIALTHYHQKLGPLIVAHQGPLAKNFDNISQYNILQDSISTRSSDLALFVQDKNGNDYTIRIKKIKIHDPMARGGIQRYAVVLIIPSELDHFGIMIEEISVDLIEKIKKVDSIQLSLDSWHKVLNEQYSSLGSKKYFAMTRSLNSSAD